MVYKNQLKVFGILVLAGKAKSDLPKFKFLVEFPIDLGLRNFTTTVRK